MELIGFAVFVLTILGAVWERTKRTRYGRWIVLAIIVTAPAVAASLRGGA
jgi:hypothetical protein